jgi:hypothetical protein
MAKKMRNEFTTIPSSSSFQNIPSGRLEKQVMMEVQKRVRVVVVVRWREGIGVILVRWGRGQAGDENVLDLAVDL